MRKVRRHIPVRTCISCGMKRAKGDMVRLVTDEEGFLLRDLLMRREGRGVYVCNSKGCVEDLLKNKRLQRVFRCDKPVVIAGLIQSDGILSRKSTELPDQDG